ncbi:MAG: PDZ domain-containing protein [Alphaproteobacteria bacterium]
MRLIVYRFFVAFSFFLHSLAPNFAYAGDLPNLPKPYVSRGLRAVVMPINKVTQATFNLEKNIKHGVVVLSVEPNGIAATNGFMPGDVIEQVHGMHFKSPIEMDEILAYWAKNNRPQAKVMYFRGGKKSYAEPKIAYDIFTLALDLAGVGRWTTWSSGYGFSYGDYYNRHSGYLNQSYSMSWTRIGSTIGSSKFNHRMTHDQDGDGIDDDYDADANGDGIDEVDSDGDGIDDQIDNDDDNDGIPDQDDLDDDDDGVDDADEWDSDGDGVDDDHDDDDDNDGVDDQHDSDDDGDGVDDSEE